MNKKKLVDLSFKTTRYTHNKDLFYVNDSVVSACDGIISKVRIEEKKKPLQIGEYTVNIINVELANILSIDVEELLSNYSECHHNELYDEIRYNKFDFNEYRKIVMVNSLVVSKDYRGYNVLDEFTEMLFRDFYDYKTLILFHAMPFQFNAVDIEYYREYRTIKDDNGVGILAVDYYSLDDFLTVDNEMSYYKLYQQVQRCGFNRVGESNLFWFDPTKTINKIKEKIYENKN